MEKRSGRCRFSSKDQPKIRNAMTFPAKQSSENRSARGIKWQREILKKENISVI